MTFKQRWCATYENRMSDQLFRWRRKTKVIPMNSIGHFEKFSDQNLINPSAVTIKDYCPNLVSIETINSINFGRKRSLMSTQLNSILAFV